MRMRMSLLERREPPGNRSSVIKHPYSDVATIAPSNLTDMQDLNETNSDNDDNQASTVGSTKVWSYVSSSWDPKSIWQTVASSTTQESSEQRLNSVGKRHLPTDDIKSLDESDSTMHPSMRRQRKPKNHPLRQPNNEDDDDDNDYETHD